MFCCRQGDVCEDLKKSRALNQGLRPSEASPAQIGHTERPRRVRGTMENASNQFPLCIFQDVCPHRSDAACVGRVVSASFICLAVCVSLDLWRLSSRPDGKVTSVEGLSLWSGVLTPIYKKIPHPRYVSGCVEVLCVLCYEFWDRAGTQCNFSWSHSESCSTRSCQEA